MPRYRHANIAIEDITSKRDLRRACLERDFDTSGFIVATDFMGALQEAVKDEQCSLCLEQFRKHEEIVILLCEHEFHYGCAKKAVIAQFERTGLIPECPLCRVPIKRRR